MNFLDLAFLLPTNDSWHEIFVKQENTAVVVIYENLSTNSICIMKKTSVREVLKNETDMTFVSYFRF